MRWGEGRRDSCVANEEIVEEKGGRDGLVAAWIHWWGEMWMCVCGSLREGMDRCNNESEWTSMRASVRPECIVSGLRRMSYCK